MVPVGSRPHCKALEADGHGRFLHALQACVSEPIEAASYTFGDEPAVYVNEEGLSGLKTLEQERPGSSDPGLKARGGDDGIRTHDPHVANVMLSQLSYIPT